MAKLIAVDYQDLSRKGGCDTCDYGSVYIDDITLKYDDGTTLHVYTECSCDGYGMTEADWMLLLANTNSIDEIITAVKEKMEPAIEQDWMSKCIYYELNGEKIMISNDE